MLKFYPVRLMFNFYKVCQGLLSLKLILIKLLKHKYYTVQHQILSKPRLFVSRKFCYTEYKSGGQIGLLRQDFVKFEFKFNVPKRMILSIFITIMAKLNFFFKL